MNSNQDLVSSSFGLAAFCNERTHQLTTFDPIKKTKTIVIPKGEKVTIGQVNGEGYIAQLWLTFPGWFWQHWDPAAPVSQTILKTLILRILWDGESEPAVEAPMGDFFGNGLCEISNFTSRYFGMSSGGFYCKFPMPFKKGFRIELQNLDEAITTEVFANVIYQLVKIDQDTAGYFHTRFHTGSNSGVDPIPILAVQGRGHFVGCSLSAQAKERNYLSFLEAPEYVYIDDDWEQPRIVGTGLEDYFLGGWYFREGTFIGELHGVPSKDALNSSITMYRVHEADAIRFERRLRFDFINPWDAVRLKPFVYSSVAFFYLDTPKGTSAVLPDANELVCWHRLRNTDHQSVP